MKRRKWDSKTKTSITRAALVMRILKGDTSVEEVARRHRLTVAGIENLQERFPSADENALRGQPKDDEALKDEQIENLKQKLGDLLLDADMLRVGLKSFNSNTVINAPPVIQR